MIVLTNLRRTSNLWRSDGYKPLLPMSLGFLSAALKRSGEDIVVIDNYLNSFQDHNGYYELSFINILEDIKPNFVGITALSVEYAETLRLINLIRKTSKSKIIIGGPHASIMPDTFSPYVDFVVVGEGERALVDIVKGNVIGKCKTGNVVSYPPVENLVELLSTGSCHFPYMVDWNSFDMFKYDISFPEFGLVEKPIINLNTSRGCPFKCSFCSTKGIWNSSYRCFSAVTIIREIKYLCSHFGIKGVFFREDNFTADQRRLIDFCNTLIREKIKLEWACESRVDTVDSFTLNLMRKAGCKGILFGVESGSEKTLKKIEKLTTVAKIKDTFTLCHDNGIRPVASLMYGLPGETERDEVETEELVDKIKPATVIRNVFIGVPGSELYWEMQKEKEYEFFDENSFYIFPKGYKSAYDRMKAYPQPLVPFC